MIVETHHENKKGRPAAVFDQQNAVALFRWACHKALSPCSG